jgi:MFS family permease
MKEDLSLDGNQLVMFDTLFNLGYMLFQIPFLLLLSRPTIARYLFPSVELIWGENFHLSLALLTLTASTGVLTLCQHKVTSYQQLYAIRFLLGSLEAISYSGANFVLGSVSSLMLPSILRAQCLPLVVSRRYALQAGRGVSNFKRPGKNVFRVSASTLYILIDAHLPRVTYSLRLIFD